MIASDVQTLVGNFCDKEDRLDTRNTFQRFWSAWIRALPGILRLKLSPQEHRFNELENENNVIDFEGSTYNNFTLKELTVYGKNF